MSDLPTFRYHPDPVQTGSIVERPVNCVCCGKRRDYTYTGPVYAAADLVDEDGGPTAYVSRCLHCSRLLGYSDTAWCSRGITLRAPEPREFLSYDAVLYLDWARINARPGDADVRHRPD